MNCLAADAGPASVPVCTDGPFGATDDDSNSLTLQTEPPTPAKTTWTLLLYLTSAAEGCVGGETVFYPHDRPLPSERIAVPLDTGMLLLHKHGDDCLLVSSLSCSCRVAHGGAAEMTFAASTRGGR